VLDPALPRAVGAGVWAAARSRRARRAVAPRHRRRGHVDGVRPAPRGSDGARRR